MRVAERLGRALPIAAVVLTVIAGAAWLHRSSAPQSWVAVNLGALVVGLAAFVFLRSIDRQKAGLVVLVVAPAIALLALAGPGVDGVHRWIALGPLRLHAAMLGGPLFVVSLARQPGWLGAAATALLALALALQPDAGTALALATATGGLAIGERSARRLTALLAALAALGWTAIMPDPLEPVPFVEGVIPAMLAAPDPLSIAALVLLALASLAPAFGGGREGLALAAWGMTLGAASLLGASPVPLLGYGAAPIIGYAAALGMMGDKRAWAFRN